MHTVKINKEKVFSYRNRVIIGTDFSKDELVLTGSCQLVHTYRLGFCRHRHHPRDSLLANIYSVPAIHMEIQLLFVCKDDSIRLQQYDVAYGVHS